MTVVAARDPRAGRAVDLRLAVPAACAWLVAGILIGIPEGAVAVGVAFWSLATFAITWAAVRDRRVHRSSSAGLRRTDRVRGVLPLIALSCLGAAVVASVVGVNAPQRLPEAVRAAAEHHATVTGVLTVESVPVSAKPVVGAGAAFTDRVRFRATLTLFAIAAADSQGAETVAIRVAVPMVVFSERSPEQQMRIGTTLSLPGTLRLTDTGDAASVLFFGRAPPQLIAAPPPWLGVFGDLRAAFAERAASLAGDGGDLLPGLAIGDTTAVSVPLDTAMKTSSLSHLTAVSGANCAIVIAAIMLLGGYLRLRRPWRIVLSLLALLGFVVLVTPEPSVLRSSVMATLTLLAIGTGRPGRGVPTLALSVFVLIGLDPWLARNYGFALSVLATGGLLLLSGPLARVLSRWMPTPLAAVIAIPVAAQLACQPALVMLSPTLPLYGVPANLLAAPAAPVATVLGLLACLLLSVLPPVGTVLMHVAWLPSAWIAAVAHTAAALPATTLPWLSGPLGVVGIAGITAAILALLFTSPTREPLGGERQAASVPDFPLAPGRLPSRPRATARHTQPRWRSLTLILLVVGFGMYAGMLIGTGVGRALAFPNDWHIAACDIGQGDAVVVRNIDSLGVSRYALIDVGPDPVPLAACLKTLHIDRISLLLLTHYDLDHIGGIDAVIGRVDSALVGEPENSQDLTLHQRLINGGATVQQAARGDTGMLGDLRWDIFWPVRGSTLMQVGNDGSVTIGFDGHGIRSIFLGDLGEDSQEALRAVGRLSPVDVVKVAHHGSADQSAPFYADLHARLGVISVGADNRYGHPTASLLAMLAADGTQTLRTDRQGMVVIAPDPNGGLRVYTEHTAGSALVTAFGPHGVVPSAVPSLPGRLPVRLVRAHQRLDFRGRSIRRTSRGAERLENQRKDHHRATGVASGAARARRARFRHRVILGRARHSAAT